MGPLVGRTGLVGPAGPWSGRSRGRGTGNGRGAGNGRGGRRVGLTGRFLTGMGIGIHHRLCICI